MEKYIISLIKGVTAAILLTLFSCNESDPVVTEGDGTMLLSSSVYAYVDADEGIDPAGYSNTFFEIGDQIKVTVTNSKPGSAAETFTYSYGASGIFTGNPGYYFPLDNSNIATLTAIWPADAEETGGFEPDQREYENFRRADWMQASAIANGVMPTDVPVPLIFEHQNCLLEFELVGQNTNELKITELLIELTVDGVRTACWAYCGNVNGRAALLLKGGTELRSQEGYLVGTIPGANEDRYTIILNDLDVILEAGKKYLVTLTPRGYDMDIYVFIGTFTSADGERETGIGVPFRLPEEGEEGDYIVTTPVELVTMSYVIRHYTDGNTPQYTSATFVLADDFVMTAEFAGQYVPLSRSLFTGEIILNGEAIDRLPYGDGEVLQLYTND